VVKTDHLTFKFLGIFYQSPVMIKLINRQHLKQQQLPLVKRDCSDLLRSEPIEGKMSVLWCLCNSLLIRITIIYNSYSFTVTCVLYFCQILLVSSAKIQYARDDEGPDLWINFDQYIVILMSFTAIFPSIGCSDHVRCTYLFFAGRKGCALARHSRSHARNSNTCCCARKYIDYTNRERK
jgi:hypothetical protein